MPLPCRLLILLCMTLLLSCGGDSGSGGKNTDPADSSEDAPETPASGIFEPQPVPALKTRGSGGQPLYFYLFLHSEDQFNHSLSEERYTRAVPVLADLAAQHPQANLLWTVMFQGSDAETVAQRNAFTGVADLLQDARGDGLVAFGFHGHHDPTYNNRPHLQLHAGSSWEDSVDAMLQWLSCRKDPVLGGCIEDSGGGIEAVLLGFGQCTAVSGATTLPDAGYEGGPASHAIQRLLPGRLFGFGFPDHGPLAAPEKRASVRALQARMSPAYDTSPTVFWIDNAIRLNDADEVEGLSSLNLLEGPAPAAANLDARDRSRPHVIGTHLMAKYLYTAEGTSPTIYGYSHPDAPALPAEHLQPPDEKEKRYQLSFQALDSLLAFVSDNPDSRFMSAAEVAAMAAPAFYWQVSASQLDLLARWVLLTWTDRPPDWVSDGEDFYSLRDLLVLLIRALAETPQTSATATYELPRYTYGPLSGVRATEAVTASRTELLALADLLAGRFEPDQAWQKTPAALLQSTYTIASGEISAAQLLYGLAMLYASSFASTPVNEVRLPGTRAVPESYDLLEEIGCLTCAGTAWSMKPARLTRR